MYSFDFEDCHFLSDKHLSNFSFGKEQLKYNCKYLLKFTATTTQKNVLIKCVESPCYTDQTSITIKTNRTTVLCSNKVIHELIQREWNNDVETFFHPGGLINPILTVQS